MRAAGVGRVLVASLHQAISEVLPTRLGFYEHWLNPRGLHEGRIGLAPLLAVLSFLRQEGDAYDRIMTRAGEYAAEWTVSSMAPFERALIDAAPDWARSRLLLGVARTLVRRSYEGSRAISRLRRGSARIDLADSIFCSVREPVAQPLCRFYAAAFARLLSLFNLESVVTVESCRGTGDPGARCVVSVSLSRAAAKTPAEVSAA